MSSRKGGSCRPSRFQAFLLTALLAASAARCASRPGTTAAPPAPLPNPEVAHDGSSLEHAIPILEVSESAGIAAERAWIQEHFPGARKLFGGVRPENGHYYDVVALRLPDGSEKTLYFDISAFYGR